ncbi:MAG: hypothetical protein AAFU54_10110 [Chloroflexota bacterium]
MNDYILMKLIRWHQEDIRREIEINRRYAKPERKRNRRAPPGSRQPRRTFRRRHA